MNRMLTLAAVVLALTAWLAADVADAKRLGGGRSFGATEGDGLDGALGVALGVLGAGVIWRWAPNVRPPPRRFASAMSAASQALKPSMMAAMVRIRFMVPPG